MTAESPHDRIEDDLPLLVGGGLAPERAAELREHLASCSACAGRYWDLVDVRDLLAETTAADPRPPAGAILLRESLALPASPGRPVSRPWRPLAALEKGFLPPDPQSSAGAGASLKLC